MNFGLSSVSSIAIEFTVKSRRPRSPSSESPNETMGFLESLSYFSLLYVVISIFISFFLAATVPNLIPKSQTSSAKDFRIFLIAGGCASVVKSKSFPNLSRSRSRTGPPTRANV